MISFWKCYIVIYSVLTEKLAYLYTFWMRIICMYGSDRDVTFNRALSRTRLENGSHTNLHSHAIHHIHTFTHRHLITLSRVSRRTRSISIAYKSVALWWIANTHPHLWALCGVLKTYCVYIGDASVNLHFKCGNLYTRLFEYIDDGLDFW